MTPPDPNTFDEREQELLRSIAPPRALDDARLQAAMQQAQEFQARRVAAAPRRRVVAAVAWCAAAAVLATVFWTFWNRPGQARGPASLAEALVVAQNAANHRRGDVQAAMHKLYVLSHRLLAAVAADATLGPRTRDVIRRSLSEPIGPVRYDGGFETLLDKVEKKQALTDAEVDQLTRAAQASVVALRALGREQALHAAEIKLLCDYLRKDVAEPSGQGGDGPTKESGQH